SPTTRLDVNRLDRNTNPINGGDHNTLGGAVVTGDLTAQAFIPDTAGRMRVLDRNKYPIEQEPDFYGYLDSVQLIWDRPTAYYENALPARYRDLTRYAALEFRVGEDFSDTVRNSPTKGQDFSVVLTDGAGATASVKVSDWSTALYYPPGKFLPLPRL